MLSKSQAVNDQAMDWAVRKNNGPLARAEQAELEAWLAADIRHLGAYAKAQAIITRLDRMHGVSLFRSISRKAAASVQWSRRRLVLTGGAVSGLAAAGIAGAFFWRTGGGQAFVTTIGQTRRVALEDGSAITLNTNTSLLVRYSRDRREIHLARGETLFDVAKDKVRPFVVIAEGTQVRAVGTSFAVTLLPKRPLRVVVKEGVVEMDHVDRVISSPVRVSANVEALASRDSPITTKSIPEEKITRDLEWQHGRIAFENQTLQGAAEEFARYSETKIVVDQAAAHRTITGLFASNDPVGFAREAAALLDLRVAVKNRQVRIF